jgi:hypothetical protein
MDEVGETVPVPVLVPVPVAALPVVGGVAWKRACVAVDSRPADATNEPVGRFESERTSKRYVSLSSIPSRGVTKIREDPTRYRDRHSVVVVPYYCNCNPKITCATGDVADAKIHNISNSTLMVMHL